MPKFNCSMGDPLDMLGEEGAEVAQAVFKLRRFGDSNKTNKAYTGPTPIEEIHKEAADFLTVLTICVEEGLLNKIFLEQAVLGKLRKLKNEFGYILPSAREANESLDNV